MTAPAGLIVGRFDPPHLGHSFLISDAAARCERLAVYVNSGPRDAVPGDLRARWLADLHPDVTVVEVVHDLRTDWDDEVLWHQWIELFRRHWPFASGPDIVCSSDPYIVELARRLDADAVVVDAERATVPISATMIRNDPAADLERLSPVVRELGRRELAVMLLSQAGERCCAAAAASSAGDASSLAASRT